MESFAKDAINTVAKPEGMTDEQWEAAKKIANHGMNNMGDKKVMKDVEGMFDT
jgi:hypothetical protein